VTSHKKQHDNQNEKQSEKQGDKSTRREIKSFILRQGRRTKAQQHALDHYWTDYGIEFSEQILNFKTLFNNNNETILEIGFGNGDSLLQQAINQPEYNFIGIEVHSPGVGHLIHYAHAKEAKNLKVIRHDAIDVLKYQIADESIKQVQLFFPDPWHKQRHQKRRIMNTAFTTSIFQKLKPHGSFHMATDWQHYAKQMLTQMDAADGFINTAGQGHYSPTCGNRCETKFERRGLKLGHGVWDLIYQKKL
jgi:tRNA (guanine-N7-)-methyltransferase